ncbi:MAG: hypothetical protein IKD03_03370, partial [Clostridia bacterium]|nr:hypothetical protein [Clostridia bacterium]
FPIGENIVVSKKTNKIFIIIKIISTSIFATLFLSIIALFIWAQIPLKVDDKSKYLETDGFKSDFVSFPKTIENYHIQNYHYYDYKLVDGCEIILTIAYDNATFDKELDRLNSTKYVFKHFYETKSVVMDENKYLFNYFTYVSTYNPNENIYEYACVDFNKKEIVFILLDQISLKHISIDNKYLPKILINNESVYQNYYYDIYSTREDYWIN